MSAFEWLAEIFAHEHAAEPYHEGVTLADHMLQTAALAAAANASTALVVAALVHDVGHCIPHPAHDGYGNRFHADLGADILAEHFSPAVTEPVRLHVAAKRYLVSVNPSYRDLLSPASIVTLELQGGPFDAADCRQFEREAFAQDALAVRRWDEAAKSVGRARPDLPHYRGHIERAAGSERGDDSG